MFPVNAQPFERTIGIMTKFWEAGRVKTRLAQSMLDYPDRLARWTHGHDGRPAEARQDAAARARLLALSARLHERFVVQLLDELQDCGDERQLVGTPPPTFNTMRAIAGPNWQVVDQGPGNLGDRMKRWFAAKSDIEGNKAASVLIGSDCPLLSRSDLDGTWDLLSEHDIVLGPAIDGGYYLIGIAGCPRPEKLSMVFDDIAWSTSTVLEQTIEAIEKLGWSLAMLPPRRDVDCAEDLAALLDSFPHRRSESLDRFYADLIRLLNSVPT